MLLFKLSLLNSETCWIPNARIAIPLHQASSAYDQLTVLGWPAMFILGDLTQTTWIVVLCILSSAYIHSLKSLSASSGEVSSSALSILFKSLFSLALISLCHNLGWLLATCRSLTACENIPALPTQHFLQGRAGVRSANSCLRSAPRI